MNSQETDHRHSGGGGGSESCVGPTKTLAFTLSEMGSSWKDLS